MAKKWEEHAGSGIDKPDPKTLMEKVSDTLKSALPDKLRTEKSSPADADNGTKPHIPE